MVRWEIETGEYEVFTSEDGLACNRVLSAEMDRSGALWFGTDGCGLTRFAQGQWTTYTTADGLPSNVVRAMDVDLNGDLWIATDQGVTRFDGARFSGIGDALDFYEVAVDPEGVVWLGRADRVGKYEHGEFNDFFREAVGLDMRKIHSILFAPDQSVWAGAISGVYRYDGKSWQEIYDQDGNSFGVDDLAIEPDGTVWAGTNDGLFQYDGQEFVHVDPADQGLRSAWVTELLYQEETDTLWIGTFEQGVGAYRAGQEVVFQVPNVFGRNEIFDMVTLTPEKIWISDEINIYQYDRQGWTEVELPDSPLIYDLSVTESGTVWVATSEGAYRFDGAHWQALTEQDGLPSPWVNSIAETPGGEVWIGMSEGLFVWDLNGSGAVRLVDGFEMHSIGVIEIGKDGSVWVGGDDGVAHYSQGQWTTYWSPMLRGTRSIALHPDGPVWAAAYDGLVTFDGREWSELWRELKKDEAYISDFVTTLEITGQGQVWVGSHTGVSVLDGMSWESFTVQDGLAGNSAFDILILDEDRIWIATNGGISEITFGEG